MLSRRIHINYYTWEMKNVKAQRITHPMQFSNTNYNLFIEIALRQNPSQTVPSGEIYGSKIADIDAKKNAKKADDWMHKTLSNFSCVCVCVCSVLHFAQTTADATYIHSASSVYTQDAVVRIVCFKMEKSSKDNQFASGFVCFASVFKWNFSLVNSIIFRL